MSDAAIQVGSKIMCFGPSQNGAFLLKHGGFLLHPLAHLCEQTNLIPPDTDPLTQTPSHHRRTHRQHRPYRQSTCYCNSGTPLAARILVTRAPFFFFSFFFLEKIKFEQVFQKFSLEVLLFQMYRSFL
jgi:hypothetical protein